MSLAIYCFRDNGKNIITCFIFISLIFFTCVIRSDGVSSPNPITGSTDNFTTSSNFVTGNSSSSNSSSSISMTTVSTNMSKSTSTLPSKNYTNVSGQHTFGSNAAMIVAMLLFGMIGLMIIGIIFIVCHDQKLRNEDDPSPETPTCRRSQKREEAYKPEMTTKNDNKLAAEEDKSKSTKLGYQGSPKKQPPPQRSATKTDRSKSNKQQQQLKNEDNSIGSSKKKVNISRSASKMKDKPSAKKNQAKSVSTKANNAISDGKRSSAALRASSGANSKNTSKSNPTSRK